MRLTWVSGDKEPQQVEYGDDGKTQTSEVSTFTQENMCSESVPRLKTIKRKKKDGKCDVTICSFLIKLLLYSTFLMIIQYIQVPPCRAQPKILGGMILATFIQQ